MPLDYRYRYGDFICLSFLVLTLSGILVGLSVMCWFITEFCALSTFDRLCRLFTMFCLGKTLGDGVLVFVLVLIFGLEVY